MKLINIEDGAVTLQLSREELKAMRNAVSEAIQYVESWPPKYRILAKDLEGLEDDEVYQTLMEEGLEETSLEQLERSIKYGEKLLPQLYDLSDALIRIAMTTPHTTKKLTTN